MTRWPVTRIPLRLWRQVQSPSGHHSARGGLSEVEIEVSELAGVGHEVDLGDPAFFDGEGDDGDRLLAREDDYARVAVDDCRPGVPGEACATGEDAAGDVVRAFDRPAVTGLAGVGAEDDVGVEDLDQRLEVAVASGREEGVHDAALFAEVGVGPWRCSLDASPGAAGELPDGCL